MSQFGHAVRKDKKSVNIPDLKNKKRYHTVLQKHWFIADFIEGSLTDIEHGVRK